MSGPRRTLTVRVEADAYVSARAPNKNYAAAGELRVDGSPIVRSYLRFDLVHVRGQVAKATLRLFANSRSTSGYEVLSVPASSWRESRVTFTNAPRPTKSLARFSGETAAHSWTTVDVTPFVQAAVSRHLTIVVVDRSTKAISLASRDDRIHAARLIVMVGAGSVSTTASHSMPAAPKLQLTSMSRAVGRPAIVGTARVGRLLTGVPPPEARARPRKSWPRFSYQWLRCDWTGSACQAIAGTARLSYRLTNADLGRRLRIQLQRRSRDSRLLTIASVPSDLVEPQGDPMIGAAGDIACNPTDSHFNGGRGTPTSCAELAVSDLLLAQPLTAVLSLGDTEQKCGRADGLEGSYDPSWGRLKAITHPIIGNHEYGRICGLNDPKPYFDYFGRAAGLAGKGWYSYDLGAWHLIALNSECSYGQGADAVGGCGAGSPQETWLRADLASHPNFCTLAYWHEPRFSSGKHGDAQQMATIWNELVAAHADVVLDGHNHVYERFDPIGATPEAKVSRSSTTTGTPSYQNPNLDPNGIREFVVGTGGNNHVSFTADPLAGEQVRDDKTFGVLLLTLHPTSYDWRFVPVSGSSFTDSGTGACH